MVYSLSSRPVVAINSYARPETTRARVVGAAASLFQMHLGVIPFAALLAPLVGWRSPRLRDRWLAAFMALATVDALSLLAVSPVDLPMTDIAGACLKILLLALNLVMYARLLSTSSMRDTAIRWCAVTCLAAWPLLATALQRGQPWKYLFATPVALLVLALLRTYPRWSALAALALAGINLLQDFRSEFGLLLLVVLLANIPRSRHRLLTILLAAPAVATVTLLAVSTYGNLAAGGDLGATARARYENEFVVAGTPLSGRGELLVTTLAFRQHPWTGWGAEPRSSYYALMSQTLNERGYSVAVDPSDPEAIPTHSVVGLLSLQTGLLGIVTGIALVALAARLLARACFDGLGYLSIYAALQFGWDVLFSPFDTRSLVVLPLLYAVARRPTVGNDNAAD